MRALLLLPLMACVEGKEPAEETGEPAGPPEETAEHSGGDESDPPPPADADADGYDETLDCDDGDPGVHPAADELCDGVDQDCDGETDEHPIDATVWYRDLDGDGYGDPAVWTQACDASAGRIADGTDCDDSDELVHPGAEERCNGVDDDCDLRADEKDADGDGELDAACGGDDCDDADPAVNPEAEEVAGDGVDNDCDPDTRGDAAVGELDAMDGAAVLLGQDADDLFGVGLAAAGDLNGDGLADLWVGARGRDTADAEDVGEITLVHGPLSGEISAADAAATLTGTTAAEAALGQRLAALGDMDGDGHDEVVAGAHQTDPTGTKGGMAWVFAGPFSGDMDASASPLQLYGVDGDQLGFRVAGPGDADGDGLNDLLVSSIGEDTGGSGAGAVYLVWGGAHSGEVATGGLEVAFTGSAAGDQLGNDLAFAGDMDGDGLDDVSMGARYHAAVGAEAGAAWVFLSDAGWASWMSVDDADFTMLAVEAGDLAGGYLWSPGDLDGDGGDDLLTAAAQADPTGDKSGEAYLILSGTALGVSYLDLALADARLSGEDADDLAGAGVGCAGDADGDGAIDLLFGANGRDDQGGAGYLIYGPLEGSRSLAEADTIFRPPESDVYMGTIPVGLGDMNGDGYDDYAFSGDKYDAGLGDVGAVFVWAGGGI